MSAETLVNLFCSGHTFLPDGRLLVAGGHLFDSLGLNQSVIYDAHADTWTPTALMNDGRWYPTAMALPDGTVLVLSGAVQPGHANFTPQVWNDVKWTSIAGWPDQQDRDSHDPAVFPLFPRLRVASSSRVFMSGSEAMSWRLDVSGGGSWTKVAARDKPSGTMRRRSCTTSTRCCTSGVATISAHRHRRRTPGRSTCAQHSAVDRDAGADALSSPPAQRDDPPGRHCPGVTGRTRGGGGANQGFNDLTLGQPVHVAECWNPTTGRWIELSAESVDRC